MKHFAYLFPLSLILLVSTGCFRSGVPEAGRSISPLGHAGQEPTGEKKLGNAMAAGERPEPEISQRPSKDESHRRQSAHSRPLLAAERLRDSAEPQGRPAAAPPHAMKKLGAIAPGLHAPHTQTPFHTESYRYAKDNDFLRAKDTPLSTFSADVDTASYANVRRFIHDGGLPPADAVRIEELVNYFPYDYQDPSGEHPFAVHIDGADAPWNRAHRLVRIGIKTADVDFEERKPANLVFLLDVSGSMNQPNKLPLVKQAMRLLTENLGEKDRVAIVVYAGASGVVLPSTSGANGAAILEALERLRAGRFDQRRGRVAARLPDRHGKLPRRRHQPYPPGHRWGLQRGHELRGRLGPLR